MPSGVLRRTRSQKAFNRIEQHFFFMADETSPAPADGSAPQEPPKFTTASTVDELVKAAYFVADEIGEPEVEAVSPTQVNVHYPSDGSMVAVRVEARPGAWGGVSPQPIDDAGKEAKNKAFSEQKKAADEKKAAASAPAPAPEPEPMPQG